MQINKQVIRRAVSTKQINLVSDTRDLSLFNINRPIVEQRHKIKLLRKGFTINE